MFFDAHNHLHDPRLGKVRENFVRSAPRMGIAGAVVNGTREDDWDAVAALASEVEWVRPSFGLHPWHVNERMPEWRDILAERVRTHPGCGIGEIGLDRWIEGHDFAAQFECFTWQLSLAARENLPATIHCIRAWGALWEVIREQPVPERGFLLHAYGGPAEMVADFVRRGAYFSFSPYFLHERKAAQRELFATLPFDRILVETDAPAMPPPREVAIPPLESEDGGELSHPANLVVAYLALAGIRGCTIEELRDTVRANMQRWFYDR